MRIAKVHSWKKVIAQLLLMVAPTAILAFYLLWDANRFYTILQNDWIKQGIYFSAGLATATIFYAYRFRFITTAAVLVLFYYIAYKWIGNVTIGEFDAFFASVQFLIFGVLFSSGWIAGFGFSRSKYFTIFWSVFLIVIQIIVISKTAEIKANALISAFAPVLAYGIYIIYIAELIRNMNEDETRFGWFILKRILGFLIVLLVMVLSIFSIFQKDFNAIEKEWGNAQANYDKNKSNSESMTKENKDGSLSNKNETRLTGALNKGKRLVFVAKLDNFFQDNKTPNPLYFTSYYYTKFDTLTQAFEIDSLMPSNDLFKPDPSKMPLYFAKTDSSVIKNTNATRNRKVVSADIYKVLLSPDEYLAPATAFFCQPIGIPKEYKEQYKSAYRAKMWVSDLNSAYFIYNPAGNKMLESFQQQRFDKLKAIKDYAGQDKKFMDYYTYMPKDAAYDKITTLAHQITMNAKTPVDKMIAIRDYFLSKDEFGQPLFKYSDNPGIPGVPSANKLTYFLFENRKGYCAYFAGATLFLLRSLGIPSRMAAGFLTVDRSSKNPGWYWFYEDQAHAWVQVYFPGYGWIDFDTTVPDLNTQQSPQPDGTPPLNLQQAYLVADGQVVSVDTVAKRVLMNVSNLLYHDENYTTTDSKELLIDVSRADIDADTGIVSISKLTKGMHITAASYAEVLKNMNASTKDSMLSIFKKLPNPVPVDEIKIIEKDQLSKTLKKIAKPASEPIDWLKILSVIFMIILVVIVLIFAAPWVLWQYFHIKAKQSVSSDKVSAYYKYRAALFYLNQMGFSRVNHGPQQYASAMDQLFTTNLYSFSQVYQKLKYSNMPLTENEQQLIHSFYKTFIQQVRRQIPFKTRFSNFLNIYPALYYFKQPQHN